MFRKLLIPKSPKTPATTTRALSAFRQYRITNGPPIPIIAQNPQSMAAQNGFHSAITRRTRASPKVNPTSHRSRHPYGLINIPAPLNPPTATSPQSILFSSINLTHRTSPITKNPANHPPCKLAQTVNMTGTVHRHFSHQSSLKESSKIITTPNQSKTCGLIPPLPNSTGKANNPAIQ